MKKIARTKVLFVCLGNACRSPMAEAIALRDAADVIEPSSAGFTPLGRIEPMTKQTLARNGFSSEELWSKPVLPAALETADMVINMSGRPKEAAFENASKVEDWPVQDPYGADAELYQRIFEHLDQRVGELAGRLRNAEGRAARTGNIKKKGTARLG
jgi:arsenate reductase (thioredoxin)